MALVTGPAARPARAMLLGAEGGRRRVLWSGGLDGVPGAVADVEARGRVRWAVWSAAALAPVVAAGGHIRRVHDAAEAHRLLHGGSSAEPGAIWAYMHGLPLDGVPARPSHDLFDSAAGSGADTLVRADGHLHPDAVHGDWIDRDERLHAWGTVLLDIVRAQRERCAATSLRLSTTVHAESAAALLCVELEAHGLPIDRARMSELIAAFAGPRAGTEAAETAARRARDEAVLRHAPGWEHVDLRNPAKVKELLSGTGVDVPNTRKWVLDAYRDTHPLVAALLDWRKAERIATTYGYRWLDSHVGPDDRLRGRWTACDGAGGRMTAEHGLHNLPAELRDAVAAHPGWVFVRADLGQVEPRVLAVVSGDAALAAATQAADLYAPVATRLGVDRSAAKIAVLAAMYGQRSGAAGEALKGLEAAYPVAMTHLDAAYAVGLAGGDLRTFGGRRVCTAGPSDAHPPGADFRVDAARGRFARNAVVQGAAAELFKAWAATVRATTHDLGAEIVLCLHDELLVHAPAAQAAEVAARVERALSDAARRWAGSEKVRFVADISIVERWSQATR